MRFIMVTQEMKDRVMAKIIECIHTFFKKTGHPFNPPTVKYDIKGTTAGYAVYGKFQDVAYIRLNPVIFADHPDKFIERTVPHEMAHIMAHYYYKARNYRITPHGREWKNVMRLLGIEDIKRCHSYSVRPDQCKRQQKHAYKCNCQTFALSTTRHNRALQGKKYHCLTCKGLLVYDGTMI